MYRGFRIIIIPEGKARSPRQFFLSKRALWLLVITAILLFFFIVASLVFVSKYSILSYRYALIKNENKMLRKENVKVVELRKKVEELRNFRRRVALLLGVEEDTLDLKSIFLMKGRRDTSKEATGKQPIAISPYVPFGMPTEGVISQGFSLFHPAIDLVAPFHAPVLATASGIVEKAEWDSILGNYVVLKHGDEYKTLYGHLSRFTVSKGRFIKRGELIGFVGNTGKSTGPHLHYEVWRNGKRVDPRRYIALRRGSAW